MKKYFKFILPRPYVRWIHNNKRFSFIDIQIMYRYAPWPRVVEFIQSLKPGALIADVGYGNGKYMQSTYIGRNDR